MKKSLLLLVSIISLLTFTSCEEEESPLLFAVEDITNPENVKFEYYSPDPCCVGKMYWIEANSHASELTIRCTNANSIFIGESSKEHICTQGQWKAELIDSNTITFTFSEIDSNKKTENAYISEACNIASNTKKGLVRIGIYVTRIIDGAEPTH